MLDAEVEEIRCPAYRPGFLGFWRAGYASWTDRIPEIVRSEHDASHYEVVVVGGPVWAWNACPPVRAWLTREAARLPATSFFITEGGTGAERALATMETLAGKKPTASLVLRAEDFSTCPGKVEGRLLSSSPSFRTGPGS